MKINKLNIKKTLIVVSCSFKIAFVVSCSSLFCMFLKLRKILFSKIARVLLDISLFLNYF